MKKRSQRPDLLTDPSNGIALCGGPGGCHAWTDEHPEDYRGKLIVDALGDEAFCLSVRFTPKYPRA